MKKKIFIVGYVINVFIICSLNCITTYGKVVSKKKNEDVSQSSALAYITDYGNNVCNSESHKKEHHYIKNRTDLS